MSLLQDEAFGQALSLMGGYPVGSSSGLQTCRLGNIWIQGRALNTLGFLPSEIEGGLLLPVGKEIPKTHLDEPPFRQNELVKILNELDLKNKVDNNTLRLYYNFELNKKSSI
jgi:hypothetical protein